MTTAEQLQSLIQETRTKLREMRKDSSLSKTDAGLRQIRKKLKRLQRRRRQMIARMKRLQAGSEKKVKEKKTAAPASL